jgi:hypothetical protein
LAAVLGSPPFLLAAQQNDVPGPSRIEIRVNRQADWGCSPEDAHQVCAAAARELWPYFPDLRLPPLVVDPKGGPIVLYGRNSKGEIRIRLDTHGTFWAQMTYQFSHELGHILCDYKDNPNPSKWFEEALCETASLFVLRRSAETWKTRPPYSNWKDYADALRKYADERIEKARLPAGKTLAAWHRENAEALSKNATDRPRNTTAATEILPLFEKAPERWESVGALNTGTFDASTTFPQFLEAWHSNVAGKHRAFVREVAGKFGVAVGGGR